MHYKENGLKKNLYGKKYTTVIKMLNFYKITYFKKNNNLVILIGISMYKIISKMTEIQFFSLLESSYLCTYYTNLFLLCELHI